MITGMIPINGNSLVNNNNPLFVVVPTLFLPPPAYAAPKGDQAGSGGTGEYPTTSQQEPSPSTSTPPASSIQGTGGEGSQQQGQGQGQNTSSSGVKGGIQQQKQGVAQPHCPVNQHWEPKQQKCIVNTIGPLSAIPTQGMVNSNSNSNTPSPLNAFTPLLTTTRPHPPSQIPQRTSPPSSVTPSTQERTGRSVQAIVHHGHATVTVKVRVINNNGGTMNYWDVPVGVNGRNAAFPPEVANRQGVAGNGPNQFYVYPPAGVDVIMDPGQFSIVSANFNGYFKISEGFCSGQIFVDEDLTCTIIYDDKAPVISNIPVGQGRLIVNLVADNANAPRGTGLRASDIVINIGGIQALPRTTAVPAPTAVGIPAITLDRFPGPGRVVSLNAGTWYKVNASRIIPQEPLLSSHPTRGGSIQPPFGYVTTYYPADNCISTIHSGETKYCNIFMHVAQPMSARAIVRMNIIGGSHTLSDFKFEAGDPTHPIPLTSNQANDFQLTNGIVNANPSEFTPATHGTVIRLDPSRAERFMLFLKCSEGDFPQAFNSGIISDFRIFNGYILECPALHPDEGQYFGPWYQLSLSGDCANAATSDINPINPPYSSSVIVAISSPDKTTTCNVTLRAYFGSVPAPPPAPAPRPPAHAMRVPNR